MDNLTQKTVNTLLDLGADLVGIAPVERFAHAPDGLPAHRFYAAMQIGYFHRTAHFAGYGRCVGRL